MTSTFYFTITPTAEAKIKYFMRDSSDKVFRVGVTSGGCNGFSYIYKIDTYKKDDHKIMCAEIIVVIDSISQKFLNNAKLDYIDNIAESGFSVINPEAKSSCGCGVSFDI